MNKITLQMTETLDAEPASVRVTKDGYLTALAHAARTGVQIYKGYEVGDPSMREVRVYRPEEEVFHEDALSSIANKPVTNDHPPVPVDSVNWKKYGVGHIGSKIARDGEFVEVPLILMDQDTIRDYRRGKKQLSMGYTCDLVWDAGNAPDGTEYDAVQRNIRANHLAVVANARGGSELKIGDDNEGDDKMTLKSVTVDGLTVEMTDIAAQQVNKTIAALDARVSTLDKELKDAREALAKAQGESGAKIAELTTTVTTKDAEIATLKKKVDDSVLTPAQLDAKVTERVSAVTAARKVLGDKLVIDGKTIEQIRRQVVDSYMGADAKDWDDAAVAASFAAICKAPGGGQPQNGGGQQFDRMAAALSDNSTISDGREKAYADYEKGLQESWRKKPAAA